MADILTHFSRTPVSLYTSCHTQRSFLKSHRHCRKPPTIVSATLTPFWTELRKQAARLEGLAALPLSPELREISAGKSRLRAGAFHSDRIRLGRFLWFQNQQAALFSGALWPTTYSRHPPLVFDVLVYKLESGDEKWMISLDFLPFSDGFIDENDSGDELLTPSRSMRHEDKVLAALIDIRSKYSDLAVQIDSEYLETLPFTSRGLCIFSSERFKQSATQQNKLTESSSSGVENGLAAFSEVLKLHLDSLVLAPLNASPAAVASVAMEQSKIAEHRANNTTLVGFELIEEAFGPDISEYFRQEAMNDAWGLSSMLPVDDIYNDDGTSSAILQGHEKLAEERLKRGSLLEYIYIDPRFE